MVHVLHKNTQAGISIILFLLYTAIALFAGSVIYGAVDTTIKRAHDSRRLSDFTEMRRALELYYHDHDDYPIIKANNAIFSTDPEWENFLISLKPYMTGNPRDPKNNAPRPWEIDTYSYAYITGEKDDAGVRTYDLVTQLEDKTNSYTCIHETWKIHVSEERFGWCDHNPNNPYGSNDMMYADH